MKKIFYACLVILAMSILISGCTGMAGSSQDSDQNKPVGEKPNVEQNQDSTNRADSQAGGSQQPHQFGGFEGAGEEFKGGSTVSDYNLSSVRRVPHPEFIRLVFEFTRGDSGEFGEAPPDYTVRLEKDSQSINIILNGVTKADVLKNKQQVISLSKLIKDVTFTPQEGSRGIVTLELFGPVTFQVFDLGNPARVVVVLKPEGGQVDKL